MATTTGNEYDHITISDGTNQTVHYLKDNAAREDLEDLKSAVGEVKLLISDSQVTGAAIQLPENVLMNDLILKGATTSVFDGMAIADGVNIKVTGTNGQTDTTNNFMIGSSQIPKANGANNFVTSWINTQFPIGGETAVGRSNSGNIEISLLRSRCDYTVNAVNAYLAQHPLVIWYVSQESSPTSFYQCVKCTTSDKYYAIGTMEAVAQLAAGDSINFSNGKVVINNSPDTVAISGNIKDIPQGALLASYGNLEVKYATPISGRFAEKVSVNGWNEIGPRNTTFFDNANYFNPDEAVFATDRFVTGSGYISVSSNVSSLIIKVKPSTDYVLYIPGNNRGQVAENDSDVFTVDNTYNNIYDAGYSETGFQFTTGANAHYIFAYFYNGSYDYNANKNNILLLESTSLPAYTTPVVQKKNLPQDIVNGVTPFNQKNLLIFGDSITDTCTFTINASDETTAVLWENPSNSYTPAGGSAIGYSMWPKIIKESQDFEEVRNYAFSGASYKTSTRGTGNERQNVQYQITVALNDRDNPNNVWAVDNFVPDIVIFALGTNDGAPSDTFESAMAATVYEDDDVTIDVDATIAALDDTKTIASARKAFLRIKQAFPMAQIYCVLPIQRANDETNWGTLRTYLTEMAKRCGCIIIDGTAESGITREFNIWNDVGEYLKDGLHPNDKGQNLMARMILASLKSHYIPFGAGFNPMN